VAARNGHGKLVRALLRHGARCDLRCLWDDGWDWTQSAPPLALACLANNVNGSEEEREQTDAVRALLEDGRQDAARMTDSNVLECAVYSGRRDVVRLVVQERDPKLIRGAITSAFLRACKHGKTGVAGYLIETVRAQEPAFTLEETDFAKIDLEYVVEGASRRENVIDCVSQLLPLVRDSPEKHALLLSLKDKYEYIVSGRPPSPFYSEYFE